MYRHGLVHLYQPKILSMGSRKILKWFFYRGNRHMDSIPIDSDIGKVTFNNVTHLQAINLPQYKSNYYLPICVDALCEDFIGAIKNYKEAVKKTKSLQRKWRTAVNAICKLRQV